MLVFLDNLVGLDILAFLDNLAFMAIYLLVTACLLSPFSLLLSPFSNFLLEP